MIRLRFRVWPFVALDLVQVSGEEAVVEVVEASGEEKDAEEDEVPFPFGFWSPPVEYEEDDEEPEEAAERP